MNTQIAERLSMAPGQLVHLFTGGELRVTEGRVWLTRSGDLDDHLIEAGQRIRLNGSEGAIIEAWQPAAGARVQWLPQRQPLPARAFAGALRGFAAVAFAAEFGARVLARGFAALARNAASSARRAQGCISIGDSIASSGALK